MKKAVCTECTEIVGLIKKDSDRQYFIELTREFVVCTGGHNTISIEDYEGDPDLATPFYQAD